MQRHRLLFPLVLTALLSAPAGAEPQGDAMAQAEAKFRSRAYAEALPLYAAAAAAARAAGDRSAETEALAQVARMYSAMKRLDEGRPALAEAAALARPEEPLGWTRYLGVRGIFERESGDRTSALATFVFMYDESLRLGLPLRAIDAAHHAAIVAPPEEQIVWAHRGIAAAEAAGSEGWLAALWNNLGATYDWDWKDYPKAAECYEKARYFHHLGGKPQSMLIADWALGRASLLAGDFDRAEGLLLEAFGQAGARLAAERNKSTLEWAGNTGWWWGEFLHRRGRAEDVSTAHGMFIGAKLHLSEAGMAEWWPEGLAQVEARIVELGALVPEADK